MKFGPGNPYRFQPGEDAKTRGANGGRKSAATKRKQVALRALARKLLDAQVVDDETKERLRANGLDPEEWTNGAAMMMRVLEHAKETGDTDAARFIRDTSGQRPVAEVALATGPIGSADLEKLSDAELMKLEQELRSALPDTEGDTLLLTDGSDPEGSEAADAV